MTPGYWADNTSADARRASEHLLDGAAAFLRAYGYTDLTTTSLEDGSPSERLNAYAQSSGADLLVAGAYSTKGIRKWLFGTTAVKLLNESPVPLFLYQ